MAEQTWYYAYDKDTKKYTGMILADQQPDFSTNIPIGNLSNPIWVPENNAWDGDNIQQMFEDIQNTIGDDDNQSPSAMLADLAEKFSDFQGTTMTSLTSVTTALADLKKQVDDLVAKVGA